MKPHWRPSLWLVLGGALLGTLGLSFTGLVALRYLGPEIGFKSAALLLVVVITLATAVLGWLLLRLILRPILALEVYARAEENALQPTPPRHFGTRETAATARRVIAMAEALRDREASTRTFVDHVIHELKTPVSAIRAAAELLEDSPTLSRDDRRLIGELDGARAQIEAELAALRRAAQARETRFLGVSRLSSLIPALATEFPNLRFSAKGETLPLPITGDGMMIVLTQLVHNAVQHDAECIVFDARLEDGGIILDITNDGIPIPKQNEAQMFQPFFTTRRAFGGTGMGLSVARNLLAAHRSDIVICPDQPMTTFQIRFSHTQDAAD